ncbi:hypothetical protein D7B12_17990 [Salmonella enterica]|nr:hypothetical protein [Salmonella enterica]
MMQLFKTPRAYKLAAIILMVTNLGNIITFSSWFDYWLDQELWLQGLFVALFHLLTIILLTFFSARMAAAGVGLERFISLMERQGFVYDKNTKEFRPGEKF